MKTFQQTKEILISKGVYKNSIKTDYTNQSIYITIPYGSLKNSGLTKRYIIPSNLNIERIVKLWFNSVDPSKKYTF